MEKTCSWLDKEFPVQRKLYYGGDWHSAKSQSAIDIYDPSNLSPLGTIADASAEDVDAAVQQAHKAFSLWRKRPPQERKALILKAGNILAENAENLAVLESVDTGNPLGAMRGDIGWSAELVKFYCGLATEIKGTSYSTPENMVDFTRREPFGVAGCLTAFNHPTIYTARQAIPALLTGNTVVIKPSPYASLTTLKLAELWQDVFPEGVFNVVTGGLIAGEALSAHRLVPHVSLVGSANAGRAVLRSCADTVKQTNLELGGKNALLAFPDANPVEVAEGAVIGMGFTNVSGQSCTSTSRVFIHGDIYDETVEQIVKKVNALRCGMPLEQDTQVGAITSKEQHKKVLEYIALGLEEGATIAAGGGAPKDPELEGGLFIEPTVFTGVDQSMRIANEEIFGPVMGVHRWDNEAQMLEEVNRVEYGLSAAIYTNDLHLAHRISSAIESGTVWVNHTAALTVGAPFGGLKQSGIGQVMCLEHLLELTQTKNVHMKLKI